MLDNIAELKSADYNPRSITAKALEGLKFSLEEFGDISGIVYNTVTGNLVSGHQRVRALIEKYGKLPIVEGKITAPNNEVFQVRYVSWSLEKEKAANVAANSETIQGAWTEDARILLDEIALQIPDMFNNLNFGSLTVPELSFPVETIDVEKQKSDIPQEQRNSLKFGDVTMYISDTELDILNEAYENYVEENRTNFGFVHHYFGVR